MGIIKSKYFINLARELKIQKATILNLVIFGIVADIVFVPTNSDIRLFIIFFLYVSCILFFKLKSKLTFALSLLLVCIMFLLFLFTGTSVKTEKAAVWIFFFILTGIIQQLKE